MFYLKFHYRDNITFFGKIPAVLSAGCFLGALGRVNVKSGLALMNQANWGYSLHKIKLAGSSSSIFGNLPAGS
jgi:hypothetical protein